MKKAVFIALAMLAVALITGCAGPEGNVYIFFNWTYTPDWFNTTDPYLPDTIYRNAVTGKTEYAECHCKGTGTSLISTLGTLVPGITTTSPAARCRTAPAAQAGEGSRGKGSLPSSGGDRPP